MPQPITSQPRQMNAFGKIRLLLWKNYLLQLRHYIHTAVDIFLPVVFFMLCAYLSKISGISSVPEQTFPSLSIDSLEPVRYRGEYLEDRLIFTPNNTIFTDLVIDVSKQLNLKPPIGVSDENQLQDILANKTIRAGIAFHHSHDINELPKSLAYSLRFPAGLRAPSYWGDDRSYSWKTDKMFPKDGYKIETAYEYIVDPDRPSYHKEGFLAIQNAIAKAFIAKNNRSIDIPEIRTQRFPTPLYSRNALTAFSIWLVPLFVLISFNYTFMNTIRFIVIEKEKQLKESMRIMGLANWMHYLSWFIRTIIMLLISFVLVIILLTTKVFGGKTSIFPNSNVICLFFVFTGYSISLISFGFILCAFFTKSKTAITVSSIVWYLLSVPFFVTMLLVQYETVDGWLRVLLCFLPNTAISYSLCMIIRLEALGSGLHWSTAFQTTSVYDNLTIATIFAISILSSILFILIALYVENVLPGAYGVAKPWYFLFTKDFWQKNKTYEKFNDDLSRSEPTTLSQLNFESEPTNKPIGIKIQNLTKRFTSDKAAVNNLSLNMYDDQITVLLGQNGAGKTTVISMLTGMIEPTAGTATVNGFDIRHKMDDARSSMGFCPQHNILFDELTVREHILFYCSLKGLNSQAADEEAKKFIRLLDLEDKANAQSSTLSGGMKRKLSVVIALCGNSKIVFLDEPTSGMDPGARRALWDILLVEKKDRTILLTTHFMDEADVLSDRIAIMANAELICSGSTFFLKKRFGTGYHLICAKGNQCDSRQVTKLLKQYIPDIQVESESDSEICYLLPDEQNHLFTMIFEDLENNESRLNVNGFGVALTTLEEIFLKLSKTNQLNDVTSENTNHPNDKERGISDTRLTLNDQKHLLHGSLLLLNQMFAMLKKRFLCWLSALPSFCYYNIVVLFVLSLATFNVTTIFKSTENLPPLEFNFDKYKSPLVVLQNSPELADFTTKYSSIIGKSGAKLQITSDIDMQSNILKIAQTSFKEYLFQFLVAASVLENRTIVAWFNDQPLHSAALSLDLVHNAFIKVSLGDDYGIRVTNQPLPFSPEKNSNSIPDAVFTSMFPMIIGIMMSVYSASYVTILIKEKGCNARFLQYVSGMNLFVYWTTSILWDILTNCITIIAIIILLALGKHEHWKSFGELSVVFLILLVYNIAMMPVICVWSLMPTAKPSMALNVVTFANIIIVFVYKIIASVPQVPKFITDILSAYPLCTLSNTFEHLVYIRGKNVQNVLSWNDGIGKQLLLMFGVGIVAFVILIVIEAGAIKMIKQLIFPHIKRNYRNDNTVTDDDVLREKQRIDRMGLQQLKSETLAMKDVSKFYGSLCAVNKTSIAIKRGECFGLLGKNGAGKSSIFKMLTGETMITAGEIYTHGYNQKYQLSKIYNIIGYCPQFDALMTSLTCRQTLEIFAMIRGVSPCRVKSYVEYYAQQLDFIQHIDKKALQLSGGNKRKLSTALALIGNSSVIFLDEPSTGMDPATKRNLWNFIIQLRNDGKSVVLTSHSIEECEALCTRMTVLVNGQSKCLGSSQHLKNKFCKGFELKIKAKQHANLDDVNNFVLQTFSGAIYKEVYQNILTYNVPVEVIKWSTVFGIMENAKQTSIIEDYSISQNSLEQVILMFVKDQKDQTEKKKKSKKDQNDVSNEESMI